MTEEVKRAYLELHVAVLLFGITAILGDLIQLQEMTLVWWRMLITSLSLLCFVKVWKNIPKIPRAVRLKYMGIGIVVALHWVLFYGAVKYANASICLVCMATASFFTALIEPAIMKTKYKWYEIALGFVIIPGMALIVQYTPPEKMVGVYMGVASALLAVIFSVLNKRMLEDRPETDSISMTLVELGSGFLFLTLVMPFYLYFSTDTILVPQSIIEWVYLFVLALLCTTLAYVLALRALRHISAFTANLTINLEPVYGIILAWIILKENEELNPNFYIGVAIVLLTVFIHPFVKRWFEKAE